MNTMTAISVISGNFSTNQDLDIKEEEGRDECPGAPLVLNSHLRYQNLQWAYTQLPIR
jgi:hypothetical protein